MGKVIKKIYEVRAMTNFELLQRYKHIAVAQGIRVYLASKPDSTLDIEVRLIGEEIARRMVSRTAAKTRELRALAKKQ